MGSRKTSASNVRTKVENTIAINYEESNLTVDPEELKDQLGIHDYSAADFYGNTTRVGEGGVGLVLKGHDKNLGRDVAIKILRPQMRGKSHRVDRFIREARATAQLEHPNIVPVHEMGINPDWGIYFTMKKIAGEDLKEILIQLEKGHPKYEKKYTLSKLLNIFTDVCNGVAFAHSKGIIHRDLKPENIFVGDFGEVLVLDWGLVREIKPKQDGEPAQIGSDGIESSNQVNIDIDESKTPHLTVEGYVSGTPYFMSPEQAKGENNHIDHRSDIYTLGVILYQILTLRLPFEGDGVRALLDLVAIGSFLPPHKASPDRKIPWELESICLKAMSYRIEDRYQTVKELLDDIYNYLDGFPVSSMHYSVFSRFLKLCKRHPVISTSTVAVILFSLLGFGIRQADMYIKYHLRFNLTNQYIQVAKDEFVQAKKVFGELEGLRSKRIIKGVPSEETALEIKLKHIENTAGNNCQVAMMLLEGIPDQYKKTKNYNDARLTILRERFAYFLYIRDYLQTAELLGLLEKGLELDVTLVPDNKKKKIDELKNIIKGDGSLKITSDPSGALLTLQQVTEVKNGCLEAGPEKQIGVTPVMLDPLLKGSYLLTLKLSDYPEVKFPVNIGHSESKVEHVIIPSEIPSGMVYIPRGKFFIGGEYARYLRLREIEIPGFFIKKYEVTFGEYIEFMKTIKDPVIRDEYLPMVRLDRNQRCFQNVVNSANKIILDKIKPEFPVVGISREAAIAYCNWIAEKTGRECRLPTAEEWEKAARGVDGRNFVWGNEMKNEYAFINENSAAREKFGFWAPSGSFPHDVSIYGVYDMGGNVREWTDSKFVVDSPFYQIKGASSSTSKRFLYCAYSSDTPVVPSDVGFRYVFPIKEGKKEKE